MKSTNRSRLLPIVPILLAIIAAPVFSRAQEAAPAAAPVHRPRIGLALSGGGALGLAEIGVIQWLEENHIPVDRIAGTSMGSIVAAMYATGMSPAQIQDFALKVDWDEAFLPEPLYSELSYRRKQDRRDFLIGASARIEARAERTQRIQFRPRRGTVAGSHRICGIRYP